MNPTHEAEIRKALAEYEASGCRDNLHTVMRIFDAEGLAYCAHNMALYGSTRFARYQVAGRTTPIPCAEMDNRLRQRAVSDEDIYKVAREFAALAADTPTLTGDEIVKFTKAVLFLYGSKP